MSRDRSSNRLFDGVTLLAALTIVGVVMTIAVVDRGLNDERAADAQSASAGADKLSANLTAITASVAGADALAVDNRVTEKEFRSFASGVRSASGLSPLAYTEVIPGQNRRSWEHATGLVMHDTDGQGGFRLSSNRAVHAAVRFVEPMSNLTRSIVGFDVLSDPTRARAVKRSNMSSGVTLAGPISLATSAQPGLFLISAIRNPAGIVLGYLSSGISLDDTLRRIEQIPNIGDVGIVMDGKVLLQRKRGDAAASFKLCGRVFTVFASDTRSANWLAPFALGIATVMAGAGTVMSGRRERARRRRHQRAAARTTELASLAERLVGATGTDDVMGQVAAGAGVVVGAFATDFARRSTLDPSNLEVIRYVSRGGETSQTFSVRSIHEDLPLAESARTGKNVLVANRAAYGLRYPQSMPDFVDLNVHAVFCTPLSLGNDGSVGVIGFAFDHWLSLDERAELDSAATLLSQLAGRAYERASARETSEARAVLLSNFARSLTTAHSTVDVKKCVEESVPILLDVDEAHLDDAPGIESPSSRSYPMMLPGSGYLIVVHDQDRLWTRVDETLAMTAVDLISGGLNRTRVSDREREVLQHFQRTLLTAPPNVDGFEIAVAYRSAVEAIGMGGDWYSVVDAEHAVWLVIGDVAGHGPDAVALMAEVKTIIRYLLTNDTSIEQTVEQAHRTLRRRRAYASVFIASIDKASETLTYMSAGHPPMLRFTNGIVVELDQTHRPWLGVDAHCTKTPTTVAYGASDLLLLYTDGVVEERGELLDIGIRRLYSIDPTDTTDAIVQHVLSTRIEQRTAQTVDDDMAVIAIRRTGPMPPDSRSL